MNKCKSCKGSKYEPADFVPYGRDGRIPAYKIGKAIRASIEELKERFKVGEVKQ